MDGFGTQKIIKASKQGRKGGEGKRRGGKGEKEGRKEIYSIRTQNINFSGLLFLFVCL